MPSAADPSGASALLAPSGALAGFGAEPFSQSNVASADFLIGTLRMPAYLLPILRAAGETYDVPWQVLAAINEVETDYGRNLSTSAAGAVGWMQFLPATWSSYGLDANGDGTADPYDPADAIFAAARYLQAAGAASDVKAAVFAYNHASWYVDSVMLRAKLLEALPPALVDGLTALMRARAPLVLGASGTPPARTRIGRDPAVILAGSPGATVVAPADGQIVASGQDARLGRYVTIQDLAGARYTVGRLAGLHVILSPAARAPAPPPPSLAVPGPRPVAPASAGVPLPSAGPTPAHSVPAAGLAGSMPPPTPGAGTKERLFAHPSRPASLAAGASAQLAGAPATAPSSAPALVPAPTAGTPPGPRTTRARSGPSLARASSAPRQRVAGAVSTAAPGTPVLAGTPLGAAGPDGRVLLLISPPGPRATPVDPGPVVAAWRRLATVLPGVTGGAAPPASGPAAAISGGSAAERHALLEGDRDVSAAVLADTSVRLAPCVRAAIGDGTLDGRLTRTIAFLAAGGLAPSVKADSCRTAPTSQAKLVIEALGGTPVAAHGSGAAASDAAVRRLLGLGGALRPARITGPRTLAGEPNTIALPDHAGLLELDLGPATGAPALSAAQWTALVERLRHPDAPVTTTSPSAVAAGTSAVRPNATAHRSGSRSSDSSTAPSVTISVAGLPSYSNPNGLNAQIDISGNAYASAGRVVATIEFEFAPAGSGSWSAPDPTNTTTPPDPTSPAYDDPAVETGTRRGLYDIRAVVTDDRGAQGFAVQRDVALTNNARFIGIRGTGSPLSGAVQLAAQADGNGAPPKPVTFWRAGPNTADPVGTGHWSKLGDGTGQVDSSGIPTGQYLLDLDRSALPDGHTDLGVTASGDLPFVGNVVRDVVVDNTPPAVTLSPPAGTLAGTVTLGASAQDAGTGVASVSFQSSPAGEGTFTPLGAVGAPPYSLSLDTRRLLDGNYDLRAEATDHAGNVADSAPVAVTVANGAPQPPPPIAITSLVVPAREVQILGEISGSQDHESWAVGLTDAPPPIVGGSPLPYTSRGAGQIVLLRYSDSGAWRIADVLRNPDGSGWKQFGAGDGLRVSGQMTPSGESWIEVSQGASDVAVFHRAAGGPFQFDRTATDTLAPLRGGGQITLGSGPSGVYGVLRAPSQTHESRTVPVPGGGTQSVDTALRYGLLAGGAWRVARATLPPDFAPPTTGGIGIAALDPTGTASGWGVLADPQRGELNGEPLLLGRFDDAGWHFVRTGLDALDLADTYSQAAQSPDAPVVYTVVPNAVDARGENGAGRLLKADASGVWVSANINSGAAKNGAIVAHYDTAAGRVSASWCRDLPQPSHSCGEPLDLDHPAAVPDAVFDGPLAYALTDNAIDVFYHGAWSASPAPGFVHPGAGGSSPGQSLFLDPQTGWLVGPNALGRIGSVPVSGPLAVWPQPNRSTLLSAALPPGPSTTDTAGALAVGLDGTAEHYDARAGWQVDATPPQSHHLALNAVAFAGPRSAVAVGGAGTILRWNGDSWASDPQSFSLTTATLDGVAFRPDGEGWAVGAFGTILHFDGTAWSQDALDPSLGGSDVTSVTVSGPEVLAIANGNLIARGADGVWRPAPRSLLPSPAPPAGSLALASGLPDGGLAVAANSRLLVRRTASDPLTDAPVTFQGIPVALSAFRDPGGETRAYVSVAPPLPRLGGTPSTGGFPAGDGDLLLETADTFQDLSRSRFPAALVAPPGDGVVHPDPVLAIASSPDGQHAWAVGGYAGTHAADGVGLDFTLPTRPFGWRTASIWRFDPGGGTQSPAVAPAVVGLPASPGTVSFAFLSSALCRLQCAAVDRAQPDVNLSSAATQIAAFAQQPGGPAFAMLGGNARGPIDADAWKAGNGAVELRRLPNLLAPLSGLPTFAAYGPLDAVPTSRDRALPWATAFARAPAPFGPAVTPSGISPVASGDLTAKVHKFYAFDVSQNGGTIRAIVLDNAAGTLEESSPGQTAWLDDRLADARNAGIPVVAFAARPLNPTADGGAGDGDVVAGKLAAAGVLGVFTTSGGSTFSWANQADQVIQVPVGAAGGAPQIPEYEGATMTYQQPKNNGVLWYDASVDTTTGTLSVQGIPVIGSLALKPLGGAVAKRSSTLAFQAIGRRALATVATSAQFPKFPGYDNYVGIPSSACATCIGPSYTFASSDPAVGDFVAPSAPGSPYPKLNAKGKTSHSSVSGLFCAFNSGTTTVSVTSGLLTASLDVTVKPGGSGPPCGTVPGGTAARVIVAPARTIHTRAPNAGTGAPPPPATGQPAPAILPKIVVPVAPAPPPAPAPVRPPPPHTPPVAQPAPSTPLFAPALPVIAPLPAPPPVAVPPIPTAVTPVPPGGATASAQSTARREEKARKAASQSAFVVRPAGVAAEDWFYPLAGGATVLTLLLVAAGARPRPRRGPALLRLGDETLPPSPRRRR